MIVRLLIVACLLSAFAAFTALAGSSDYQLPEFTANQKLHISQGANAGFVDDKQCGSCHQDTFASFQHVGMAKSFKTPAKQHVIEDFSAKPFYHAPSKRYYLIRAVADDKLVFERYQLDGEGEKINVFSREIAHLIGSGNKTRSYFYRNEIGELYLLPLSWYSGINRWQMSPGFEKANHMGISRQVTRECMFCHNALPEVKQDSDWHWQEQTFPEKLPEGIGCQRCHGPGGEHINTVLSGKASLEAIHNSIVNPAKLTAEARDSVCLQCHLLPAVSLAGVRQYDKSVYSFRAGDTLKNFLIHVDVDDATVSRDERFEINHQGYRLRQSECFVQSKGELTCINCHNPHQKVPAAKKVTHYAKTCLACHQAPHPKTAQLKDKKLDDCISCHMPQRRAQDVVHVVMTDHKIAKYPIDNQFTAPLIKQEPVLEGLALYFDYPDMSEAEKQMYQASTMIRAFPAVNYVDFLKGLLVKHQPKTLQPYFDLIGGEIAIGRFEDAINTIGFVGNKFAKKDKIGGWKLQQWQVRALIGLKQYPQALQQLAPLLDNHPNVPEHHLYQGIIFERQGQLAQALAAYQTSCKLRPNMVTCWANSGNVLVRLGQYEAGLQAYQQALSISPNLKHLYIIFAKAAIKAKQNRLAKRYLTHAVGLFGEEAELLQILKQL